MLQPDGLLPPAPYRIADNPYTLLDKSDLVLVDAIGTGFSRAANAELSKKFLGREGRYRSVQRIHPAYLTRYERWSSPLFLFGESYGTTRAAGIAGISPTRASLSMASPCSPPRSASRRSRTPRATTSPTSC